MRINGQVATALALIRLFVPASASAAADQKTLCVLRATEALPKIAGLKVTKSGTREMPAEQLANWRGQSKPIIVDIDTDATGLNQRYSYICASGPGGSAFVQRTDPGR